MCNAFYLTQVLHDKGCYSNFSPIPITYMYYILEAPIPKQLSNPIHKISKQSFIGNRCNHG